MKPKTQKFLVGLITIFYSPFGCANRLIHSSVFPIRLGLYQRPPNFYVKRNQSINYNASNHEEATLVITKDDTHNETITFTGVWIPTIEWLAKRLNASLIAVPEWKDVGTLLRNNTWSGAIGGLLRGEVDVLGPPLLISGLRSSVLDYAGLCTSDDPVLITPIPKDEISTLVTIFKPYTIEVWVIILASLFVTAAAITVVSIFPNPMKTTTQDFLNYFYNFVLFLVAILANQGELFTYGLNRLSTAFRLACAGWCFAALVIANVYQGTLTSHLTNRRLEAPPDNFTIMLDQGKYEFLVLATGVGKEILLGAKDGPEKRMGDYLRKNPNNFVASAEEGYRRVASGCCGYGDARSYLEYLEKIDFDASGVCRVYIGKAFRSVIGYEGPVFAKNHRYRQTFHQKLLELNQHGLEKYWRKGVMGHQSVCQSSIEKRISMKYTKVMKSLSILDLSGSFFFFVLCCLVSILVFVVEQLVFRSTASSFKVNIFSSYNNQDK